MLLQEQEHYQVLGWRVIPFCTDMDISITVTEEENTQNKPRGVSSEYLPSFQSLIPYVEHLYS